jgi:chromosomal replication initiation ATPase DnaA
MTPTQKEIAALESELANLQRIKALREQVAALRVEVALKDDTATMFNRIVALCASRFGVTPDGILGPSRRNDIAWARHAAAYLIRKHTQRPLLEIAQAMGRGDHATVMNSCRQAINRAQNEPAFKAKLDEIDGQIVCAIAAKICPLHSQPA